MILSYLCYYCSEFSDLKFDFFFLLNNTLPVVRIVIYHLTVELSLTSHVLFLGSHFLCSIVYATAVCSPIQLWLLGNTCFLMVVTQG